MNLNDLPDMSDALKQVQMYEAKKKGDGNLANNAVPYDQVTRADIITGALGKDEEGGKKKPKGHDCAKLVKYQKEQYETVPEMHTLLEDGTVTHYDIVSMDGNITHFNVPVEDLEVLISEKHEHFVNYDKNAEVLGENRAAARAAGGYKDDSKKQPDPSKAGFTGIGNMSIDQIRKMSARIEKEKTKKEEFTAEGVRDLDPEKGTEERKARLEKKRGMKLDDHPQYKKEAFAFSEEEFEELALLGEEIDAMTDEELIDMMEEILLEVAEDDQDLIEICEALESVEVISERVDPKETQRRRDQAKDRLATGAAMKSAAEKSGGPSRMDRLKSAAKGAAERVGSAAKAGAKMVKKGATAAGKAAVSTAGKVAGTYQGEKEAARIKAKRASMQKTPPKEKKDDDDGTGGKLDALLKSTRGTSSSSDSGSKSGGGGESSSSGPTILVRKKSSDSEDSEKGSTRRAVGSALKSAARLVGRGIKKAVGKTARAVSSGSDKLAKRLGEDYEHIAHLYESGLFTIQEIENVIEERYKGKHGQSSAEYKDDRSPGGKMVSGTSTMSGAEYTHGRRVKAANPGSQPDEGGSTKPKSQGKMDRGTRADLEYRRANLKGGK